MPRPRRISPVARVLLVSTALAGALTASCGEDGSPDEPPVSKGQYDVDTGFRPENDGFAFGNYGHETTTTNLDVARMRELFGDKVCAAAASDTCKLTPPAAHWLKDVNLRLGNGHCEGMAVLSAMLFKKTGGMEASAFGAAAVQGIALASNDKLLSEIAKWSVTPLTETTNNAVFGADKTPKEVLDKLIEMWGSGEFPSLTVASTSVLDSHTVLPYRVVDKGSGQVSLMVYDPDYPKAEREVLFDLNKNTWSYQFYLDKNGVPYVYDGDVTTSTLGLIPISGRTGKLDCPFCQVSGSQAPGSSDVLVDLGPGPLNPLDPGPGNPFAEIQTVTCPPGTEMNEEVYALQVAASAVEMQKTGAGPAILNDCPGEKIALVACKCKKINYSILLNTDAMFTSYPGSKGESQDVQNTQGKKFYGAGSWPPGFNGRMVGKPNGAPMIHEKTGSPLFFNLKRDAAQTTPGAISLLGPGYELSIEEILPAVDHDDSFLVSPDGNSVTYTTGADASPIFSIGFEHDGVSLELSVVVKGEPGGMSVALEKDEAKGEFYFVLRNVHNYDLLMSRATAEGESEFSHVGSTHTDLDRITIPYAQWKGNGSPMTIGLDAGDDGTIDETVEWIDEDMTH
jgi:hypothetical protein